MKLMTRCLEPAGAVEDDGAEVRKCQEDGKVLATAQTFFVPGANVRRYERITYADGKKVWYALEDVTGM